ncbi:MAG: alkaline phosphatase family protein, partial [Bacteroidetes bacterium]|nr:alkaline phosphatase family protein [Bacteroidota bacterium]
ENAKEIDGVSFIGKISATNPAAEIQGDDINVQWKAIEQSGEAKIWLATTNNFKQGGEDKYELLGKAPLNDGHFSFSIKDKPSSFYKIVIEAPHNYLNRWVIVKQQ